MSSSDVELQEKFPSSGSIMNHNEKNDEILDWDKKNTARFAQYLYDLAKEKVKEGKQLEEEAIENVLAEVEEDVKEKVKAKVKKRLKEKIQEEGVEDIEEIVKPLIETEYNQKEEILKREKALEEVTIGLAKAVDGEDIEEDIDLTAQAEIIRIIEVEKIPVPSEELDIEKKQEEIPITKTLEEEEILLPIIENQIQNLEPVDLSSPIVTDPVINEEVFLKPESVPEDVRSMIFVDEATSVPITKEETFEIEESIPVDTGNMIYVDEVAGVPFTREELGATELAEEVGVTELTEEIIEWEPTEDIIIPKPELSDEQQKRRDEIIQQMLAETRKKEEEGFAVRELGETAGRVYSAVIVGTESNRNIRKWKKWDRARLRREKKRAKRLEREKRRRKEK